MRISNKKEKDKWKRILGLDDDNYFYLLEIRADTWDCSIEEVVKKIFWKGIEAIQIEYEKEVALAFDIEPK